MIAVARKARENDDFEIKGKVYAFDSTTIDLCLSVFWWAKFRKAKGGIKLHTLYDVTTHIPAFVHITPATVNDVNIKNKSFNLRNPTGFGYFFTRQNPCS